MSCQNYRARDLGRCGRYQGISHHTAVSDPGVTELGNTASVMGKNKQSTMANSEIVTASSVKDVFNKNDDERRLRLEREGRGMLLTQRLLNVLIN